MAPRTRARDLLLGWIARTGITQSALADKLGVKQPSVAGWLRLEGRPEAHMRAALELLTGGEVGATDWMTAAERGLLRRLSGSA